MTESAALLSVTIALGALVATVLAGLVGKKLRPAPVPVRVRPAGRGRR